MHLARYQQAALKTLQPAADDTDPVLVPLLGLVGETGSVATAYKKRLRDGPDAGPSKQQLREELGDVLWYTATLAHLLGLDLEDIAAASLEKTKDRWRATPDTERPRYDADYPPHEQLPRRTTVTFTPTPQPDGRTVIVLTREDGTPAGDPLTSASHIEDDYRFHDAFHLAHAAVLGWSPVTRFLLDRKRRSRPGIDEAEDGGRAIAIEEGISALVFSYASRYHYFEDVRHVDHELLITIDHMTAHLEVSILRAADWEKAIMTGYAAWQQLRKHGGGRLTLDLDAQTLTFAEP
ncbi:nucleoside triphosphate pyrophosphohydrolase family protein (plasmid) [Streptomyces laculatispora]|uniref:Nucleoside triphosphate pyrophosphohydrolase family protein n=1 Tax=Streptomyces laculatispora TaxID=887464 RepID=A0ABY9IHX2_9ACTN|nr:nucleoside triphosphate pyrophosphohydrolase family protein [Streptomyces laculatispora]WLQ45598.1 nucleoside triphosphate pyrophosphohydrolase family protein [Streptomyces laculatispora]